MPEKKNEKKKTDECHEKRKEHEEKEPEVFDFVIVGLGTAGSALARKLADAGFTVLALEYGEDHDRDPNVQVLTTLQSAIAPSFDPAVSLTFAGFPEPNAFNVQNLLKMGRMWGGSSTHNYLQYFRGTPAMWNQFAQVAGVPIWTYDQMIPAFLQLEHYTGPSEIPSERGTRGAMNIVLEPANFLTPIFEQAAVTVTGLSVGLDINDRVEFGIFQEQSNVLPVSSSTALRQSTSEVFLTEPHVVDPDGRPTTRNIRLFIESRALVDKIVFDESHKKPRAVAVRYTKDYRKAGEKVKTAYFRHRVILCAGALSANVLERSGVGDPAILTPLGIRTIVANPNVGANFGVQYGSQVYGSMVQPVSDLFVFPNILGLGPAIEQQDPINPQARRQFLTFVYPGANGPLPAASMPFFTGADPNHTFTLVFWNLNPASRGTMHISSSDPTVAPRFIQNFYANPADVTSNLAILQQTMDIVTEMSAIDPTIQLLYPPESTRNDPTFLTGYLSATEFVGYHYYGALQVGSVTDGLLRVLGVDGVSVCDTSVLPFGFDGGFTGTIASLAIKYAEVLRFLHGKNGCCCEKKERKRKCRCECTSSSSSNDSCTTTTTTTTCKSSTGKDTCSASSKKSTTHDFSCTTPSSCTSSFTSTRCSDTTDECSCTCSSSSDDECSCSCSCSCSSESEDDDESGTCLPSATTSVKNTCSSFSSDSCLPSAVTSLTSTCSDLLDGKKRKSKKGAEKKQSKGKKSGGNDKDEDNDEDDKKKTKKSSDKKKSSSHKFTSLDVPRVDAKKGTNGKSGNDDDENFAAIAAAIWGDKKSKQ